GLDHLYDNTTGGSSGPFGYPNPGGKIPNPNAIGISAFGKPLMFQQDIKKLNGKGSFAGGYSIRYSSPYPKTGYSNLSVGEGTGLTLDSTSTS
ncbi:hypothetical protein M3M33_13940, partial [Loigolactobacillus coryniformis]|uniref:hypothetical protein n=1 Tax=Loigolactobacillus coryniformis TaxID=1610 RepID=UPI00201A79D8